MKKTHKRVAFVVCTTLALNLTAVPAATAAPRGTLNINDDMSKLGPQISAELMKEIRKLIKPWETQVGGSRGNNIVRKYPEEGDAMKPILPTLEVPKGEEPSVSITPPEPDLPDRLHIPRDVDPMPLPKPQEPEDVPSLVPEPDLEHLNTRPAPKPEEQPVPEMKEPDLAPSPGEKNPESHPTPGEKPAPAPEGPKVEQDAPKPAPEAQPAPSPNPAPEGPIVEQDAPKPAPEAQPAPPAGKKPEVKSMLSSGGKSTPFIVLGVLGIVAGIVALVKNFLKI